MATWKIDEALHRFGRLDNEDISGANSPDWSVTFVTRDLAGLARHMCIQFPRPQIERPMAEEIVTRLIGGLNARNEMVEALGNALAEIHNPGACASHNIDITQQIVDALVKCTIA